MKILIVDDETISRKILFKKMASVGDCTTVDDSLKAFALFDKAIRDKKPFDLITLDVSMPKMDGRQLLDMIRKKETAMKILKENRVKIIMVTSRMNMSTIKECIKLGCNGYISKPVNKYQLLENLSRMGFSLPADIQKDEKNTYAGVVAQIIERFYKGKIKLPVLPRIVNEVQTLMEAQDPSIDDLAKIVKKDILITSKLISIANSALYKGVDKADTLNAALLRLGMKAAYGLISTLVTKDLFQSENTALNTLLETLWMHSLACACLGKQLAEKVGIKNSETVFLMGIVHDIGKMLLIKAIADMDTEEAFENKELLVVIHEIHTTFGAVVLKKMRFAKEFIQVAEFHHWNDFSKNDGQELLIIHLSDYLANEIGFSFFKFEESEETEKFSSLADLESLKQLNLDPDNVMKIANEMKAVILDSAKAF